MSAEEIITVLVITFILAIIVVSANYADYRQSVRARAAVIVVLLLVNLLLVLNGVLLIASAYDVTQTEDPPEKGNAWRAFVLSVMTAGLATVILFRPVAERIGVIFPRFRGKHKRAAGEEMSESDPTQSDTPPISAAPLFPQMLNYYTTDNLRALDSRLPGATATSDVETGRYQVRGFDATSMVHRVAVILCVYLLGSQFISFIIGGGLEGVAESFEEEGLSGWSLLLNAFPLVAISFLGVGIGLRRGPIQTLKRLGLTFPTPQGIAVSFAMTIALFVFVVSVALAWQELVSEEEYKKQSEASEALADSVTTLGLAFLVAATAAVGEEIAFRGALQPVLGLWPTSIIFALTHSQYTLTPAWLIIFGVALGFGWIRMRYNTTTAILTHFTYNFIPLALVSGSQEESLLRILGAFGL